MQTHRRTTTMVDVCFVQSDYVFLVHMGLAQSIRLQDNLFFLLQELLVAQAIAISEQTKAKKKKKQKQIKTTMSNKTILEPSETCLSCRAHFYSNHIIIRSGANWSRRCRRCCRVGCAFCCSYTGRGFHRLVGEYPLYTCQSCISKIN
jgi:hypothetical protein